MDFSRRGFLKVFGLTTAAALVEPTRTTLSLFGSNEAKAATSVMGHHLVVFSRPICRPASGEEVKVRQRVMGGIVAHTHDAQVVGVVQSQFPKHHSWMLDEGYGWENEMIVDVPPDEDPYIGFYKAAEEIRRFFTERSLQRIQSLDRYLRAAHKLVTVVHTPIHARSTGVKPGKPFVTTDRGFEVACDCDTRVVTYLDLEGWEVYSQFGEIPTEVPSELQMKVLLQYDTDIVTRSGKGWERYQRT